LTVGGLSMRAASDAKETRFPTAAPGWSAVLTGGTHISAQLYRGRFCTRERMYMWL